MRLTTILLGAAAGFAATAPMSAAMIGMKRELPWYQRYALPPRQVVRRASRAVGLEDRVDEAPGLITGAAHFGYGAACGAIYAALAAPFRLVGVLSGVVFGLGVWSVSYLGLMPVLGLFPRADTQPRQRNLLMIAAHVVWGATLGGTLAALDSRSR